ncbi:MAG: di-trans,poly-cis-decaprenylcistransferase [Candidatus Vogelbacteria bacterium CG10_big_fil_rev_8_21_14_0_10_51_16]|uniref:Isoprenyl transferase n=1 Tax=Candidatus Vogelbacteria bacterium CG10_big_fil_rev_8_21_14_0_10_51_16 TaxID=1975045 RepID=A0A2H0RGJ2_9BACT|nr:MAG: di-trans,poly-cis-decaprenylcistransferase [Candidatus Vogelbacteria bacterium CG10_big_fil_rev_8_21_14_0_10_51_16]
MTDPDHISPKTAPACIGIILDGNRRWATARGLKSWQGHEAGVKKLKEVTSWAIEAGVRHLICYTFSTENWERPKEEVDFLMKIITMAITTEMPWLLEHNVKVTTIGELSRFSKETQDALALIKYRTETHTAITVTLALNYGGRAELVRAINKLRTEKQNLLEPVTEADISGALDTAGLPDPDMVIRTSGEQRLSGFLPWQAVYSELFFPAVLWPDLSKEQFMGLLDEFARRVRRFGA